MAIAGGLLLVAAGALVAAPEQALPAEPSAPVPDAAPPTPPASTASPYEHVWTAPLDGDGDLRLIATATVAVTAGASAPVEARALSNGELVWTSPRTAFDLAHADDADGRVYGVNGREVFAIDAATGATAWQMPIAEPGHDLAVGTQYVLVLSDTALRAFGRTHGEAAWQIPLPAPPSTSLAVSPEFVTVGLRDRSVLALDPTSGATRWRATFDDAPMALAITGERVYVTLPLVALCALHPRDGRMDWCTTELRVPAVGPPVLQGGRLYLALLDTTLRAFDPHTGTMVQRTSLRGRPVSAPVPMGAALVTPLSQNAFGVVRADGTVAIVPAPAAPPLRSARQLAIGDDGSTIVMLTIDLAGTFHLSAYAATPTQVTSGASLPSASGSSPPAEARPPDSSGAVRPAE